MSQMITPDYCQLMARYNAWQNHSLYSAAAGLTEDAREMDRGAFWSSIRQTLSHLFWGDTLWISRFDGGQGPQGPGSENHLAYGWDWLWQERRGLDARIITWAEAVAPGELEGDLTWYSGFLKAEVTKPKALCVAQLFNHQTHHRGQVHGMLTAAGARPDDTDLQMMPDQVPAWH
jgi:uncharacterized damage-inducible protein DinB